MRLWQSEYDADNRSNKVVFMPEEDASPIHPGESRCGEVHLF